MKGLALLAAAVAFALTPAATPASSGAVGETRGLWVLRTSLVSPPAIDAVVQYAVDAGFNALFVQVRGRGDAFYRSAIEPRAGDLDGQPASFDPLARTIEVAHRAGLTVHAWVNVNLVASAASPPRDPAHVVRRHPEWLMVPGALASTLASVSSSSPRYLEAIARWSQSGAVPVEGLYLSPVTPEARAYTTDVVRDLAGAYALDGLHLDYIRYPAEAFDFGAATLAEFRRSRLEIVARADRDRIDRLAATDPAAWPRAFPDAWTTFRRDRVTDLVRSIRQAALAARPGLVLSAAVVPSPDEARDHRLQDWQAWTGAGLLDAVCPMLYTTDAAEYARQLVLARDAAAPAPIWAGIGAYRLRLDETAERVRLARRERAGGVLLFRYDALASTAGPRARVLADLRAMLSEAPGGGR